MLRIRRMTAGLLGVVLGTLATPAAAETVAIGTLPQGSLGFSIASAVAKVATEHGDAVQMRAVGLGGSNVFIPQVNSGEIAFSTSNTVEVVYAHDGTGNFEGRPNQDIRMVTALVPFTVGIMVRRDSDYQTLKDLAGQPFPTDYSSQKLVEVFLDAMLASEGMAVADLQRVPVPNFVKGVQLLTEGEVEGALLAPGSGVVQKADSEVGVRFLSLPATAEAEAAMIEITPNAYITEVKPRKGLAGIQEPTNLMGYEYTVIAGKDVDEETVYQTVKALYGGKEALVESHGIFNGFDPERMALDVGVPYHPGAQRFFEEAGLWPPKAVK